MKSKDIIVDLVDVSNWAHRAYFAGKGLTAPDGKTPTGVIKIFGSMLSKLMSENFKANNNRGVYLACCFDIKTTETFRYKIQKEWVSKNKKRAKLIGLFGTADNSKSPEYKGNRNKDPEKTRNLNLQIKLIEGLLKEAGILTFKKEPYEADDLLGSLAHQMTGGLARIQSRDKDFAQLVEDGKVILIMPEQANAPRKEIDEQGCMDTFGVKPNQIVQYLQLLGDGVDNIPGVPGVGPKTAVGLLTTFSTLGKLQKNRHLIKGKGKDRRLLRGEERGLPPFSLTKELATIKKDIPGLPTKAKDFKRKEPTKKFKSQIKKLGFKNLFE